MKLIEFVISDDIVLALYCAGVMSYYKGFCVIIYLGIFLASLDNIYIMILFIVLFYLFLIFINNKSRFKRLDLESIT